MAENDDKKAAVPGPPTAPPGLQPRGSPARPSTEAAKPPASGASLPSARPASPSAPVVTDPGSSGRNARPPKAATLPPGPSKAAELRQRKRRANWLPTLLVTLLALACAIVWFAPISWPFAFSLPRFDGLMGSGPSANPAPPPAARQETVASQKPEAKSSATPTPAPAKDAAPPEDEQKRRLAAVEERLVSATSQSQTDKRTIEGLQTRLADSERQAKGLQLKVDTLEKEILDLRQAARDTRPAGVAPALPAPAVAPREPQPAGAPPLPPPSRPTERQAQAAPAPAPIRPAAPPAPQTVAASAPAAGGCAALAARYRNAIVLQFGRNQDVLWADHERQLSQIAAAVAPCADVGLLVRGFTDSRGSDKRNAELSRRRAELAARFVEGRGVGRNRLSVSGFASASPLASNETEAGRARNRRVELNIQPLR